MPYGITQCYLPPGRGDIPAFTPAKARTRFSDPRGMQGWVDPGGWLEMVYQLNGHPSWTNRARCWLTSLMRPTTLTTTPSRHLPLSASNTASLFHSRHRHSRGCTGYTCMPQGGEKNLGAKFTGESCKCTPQAECAPRGRAEVQFLRKLLRCVWWERLFR